MFDGLTGSSLTAPPPSWTGKVPCRDAFGNLLYVDTPFGDAVMMAHTRVNLPVGGAANLPASFCLCVHSGARAWQQSPADVDRFVFVNKIISPSDPRCASDPDSHAAVEKERRNILDHKVWDGTKYRYVVNANGELCSVVTKADILEHIAKVGAA